MSKLCAIFRAAVKGHIKLEDGLNIRDLLDLKDAFLVRFIDSFINKSLYYVIAT